MGTLTFVFGRFQPPTKGHSRLLLAARNIAGDGELRIYPSRTCDKKNNPLSPVQKNHYLRLCFPFMASCFVDDKRLTFAQKRFEEMGYDYFVQKRMKIR